METGTAKVSIYNDGDDDSDGDNEHDDDDDDIDDVATCLTVYNIVCGMRILIFLWV
jgi:hypothetical protein